MGIFEYTSEGLKKVPSEIVKTLVPQVVRIEQPRSLPIAVIVFAFDAGRWALVEWQGAERDVELKPSAKNLARGICRKHSKPKTVKNLQVNKTAKKYLLFSY